MTLRSVTLRRWAAIVGLICVGAATPRVLQWWADVPPTPSVVWTTAVPASFLLPGRSLERRGIDTGVLPQGEEMVLRRPGVIRRVRGLAELRGDVLVDDVAKALAYVRLGSSVELAYAWAGCGGLEIVLGTDKDAQSGMMGRLSQRAYRAGRFTPPAVRQAEPGYVVERWLMLTSAGLRGRPAKVREYIGRDGRYRREEVPTPPPALPDTRWGIYGLK